jgi:hypothetical protein
MLSDYFLCPTCNVDTAAHDAVVNGALWSKLAPTEGSHKPTQTLRKLYAKSTRSLREVYAKSTRSLRKHS